MNKRDFFNTLKGITLGLIIVAAGVTVLVYAWTGPTQNPPGGNVAAPINVSSSVQVKAGSLGLGNGNPATSPSVTLDVNGKVRIRSGASAGRVLKSSDALGTAYWAQIGHQSGTWCAWVYPDLTCNVGSTYRGALCSEGQYVAGAKSGFKHCSGDSNDVHYTYVYCCNFTN